MEIQIKRVYEAPSEKDGYRVLVDRLWPRGISKEKASLDLWAKEIAPSSELRKWFSHEPEKFEEFKAKYEEELSSNEKLSDFLSAIKDKEKVTLLFGAKDREHNQAVVLAEFLRNQ